MTANLLIGLVVGALAVAVYHAAHAAVSKTADTVDRRTQRPLPGFCADCGGSQLTRAGLCATCGSNSVWCPGPMALPKLTVEMVNPKHAAIAAKVRARWGKSVTSSEAIQ